MHNHGKDSAKRAWPAPEMVSSLETVLRGGQGGAG